MAEQTLTAQDGRGNPNRADGGLLGRSVVSGMEDAKYELFAASEALYFITQSLLAGTELRGEGLRIILHQLSRRLDEAADDLGAAIPDAQSLIDAANGAGAFLPQTTTERELAQAITGARTRFGSQFICKAGLEAARIYFERYPERNLIPDEASEVKEAVDLAAQEQDGKEATQPPQAQGSAAGQ